MAICPECFLDYYLGPVCPECESKKSGDNKRIAELEDVLDDLVMEFGLLPAPQSADLEQAINRARELLKTSSRAPA